MTYSNPVEDVEGTPFNMAMLFYAELHQLRMVKSRAVINNDMFLYYDALEDIYTNISFKLNDKEIGELDKLFKDAAEKLDVNVPGKIGNTFMMYSLKDAKKILKDADRKMMKFMHKYNMIFPNIEAKGLKTLDKRYGLNG